MVGNASDGLRFFQVKISNEQAQHLPGAVINDYFSKVEMIAGLGPEDSIPRCIARVEFDDPKSLQERDALQHSFVIESILMQGDGYAYVKVKTPGTIQLMIAQEDECWAVPPTFLSNEGGFFMTIQGTSRGLKYARDNLVSLIPEKLEMRISKTISADWIAAPKLPQRRHTVMRTAVEMGYYDTPRKCTQKEIAELLGIQQGTVAEHLQYAEGIIVNSWAKQISLS